MYAEELSSEKNSRIMDLETLYEEQKSGREEDTIFYQMQLKTLKSKETELVEAKNTIMVLTKSNEELTHRLHDSMENEISLNAKMETLFQELEKAKGRLKDMDRNSNATTVLKAQQEAMLANLRKDLNTSNHAKDELARKVKDLEEYRVKAEIQLARLNEDKNRLSSLEATLDEANSLCARLRSQLQTAETNNALKTAMLATVEAQLLVAQETSSQKDSVVAESIERVTILQNRLAEAEFRIEERVKEGAMKAAALEEEISQLKASSAERFNAAEAAHAFLVESINKDFAKKSNAARIMLAERDEEVCKDYYFVTLYIQIISCALSIVGENIAAKSRCPERGD
jgi:chromosome segregation ATPase